MSYVLFGQLVRAAGWRRRELQAVGKCQLSGIAVPERPAITLTGVPGIAAVHHSAEHDAAVIGQNLRVGIVVVAFHAQGQFLVVGRCEYKFRGQVADVDVLGVGQLATGPVTGH